MPRTTIAAVLAMLLFLAPVASARPADAGYPAYPTPEVAPKPRVMPERITDHPVLPTAKEIEQALAQEQSYSTKGNPDVAALVRELRARGGDGAQNETARALQQERAYSSYGEPAPVERQPAPAPLDDNDAPWPLIGAGFVGVALLFGLAVLLVARPRRARVAT